MKLLILNKIKIDNSGVFCLEMIRFAKLNLIKTKYILFKIKNGEHSVLKFITQFLCVVLVINNAMIGLSFSQPVIENQHPCIVKINGQVVPAVCGYMNNPNSGKRQLYRTYTDPFTQEIHEQYCLTPKTIWNKNHTKTKEICKEASEGGRMEDFVKKAIPAESQQNASNGFANNSPADSAPAPVAYPRQDLNTDQGSNSKLNKYLMIGGAVVGVAAVGFGIHYLAKSSKKSSAIREENLKTRTVYPNALKNNNVKTPVDLPKVVVLGHDVPHGAGKTVRVAGAVPSSEVPKTVPRFRTKTGDTYIVQSNPNDHTLETIFLYDYLTGRYYNPGAYRYHSFTYSPFMYGSGDVVIVDNSRSYINNEYNTQPYPEPETYVAPAAEVPRYENISDNVVPSTSTFFEQPTTRYAQVADDILPASNWSEPTETRVEQQQTSYEPSSYEPPSDPTPPTDFSSTPGSEGW